MTIKRMIKKLKQEGVSDLTQSALLIEHMHHKGFFSEYRITEDIEKIKYEKIKSMVEQVSKLGAKPGQELGRVIRAGFIGLVTGYIDGKNGRKKTVSTSENNLELFQ